MRIAKLTPSGYEPKYLIINVMKPMPIPKMMPPFVLIGLVT